MNRTKKGAVPGTVPVRTPPGLEDRTAKLLTHFDEGGAARMVEVGDKPETHRQASASGRVVVAHATAEAIRAGRIGKGDVIGVARLAGIQAAKRAPDMIPLCHPLRVTGVEVNLEVLSPSAADVTGNAATTTATAAAADANPDNADNIVAITATVRAFDRSGVEMEALAAVTAAALTVYDMCKAIDRGMTIEAIRLDEKSGGKSGTWRRDEHLARERQHEEQKISERRVARRLVAESTPRAATPRASRKTSKDR